MGEKYSRREFLKRTGIAGAAVYGTGLGLFGAIDEAEAAAAATSTMAIASKGTPGELVRKAVNALGGMKKFVKKGNTVLIKPNIAWAQTPETAATTNPQVIEELVKMCKEAGAGRITILDHTCDSAATAFQACGVNDVAKRTGARLVSADRQNMYRPISIPKGVILKEDTCAKEILDADVFINVPITKVHGGGKITASMKNLMGANWDRGVWHRSRDLEQCIADYSSAVKPDLIILDAYRALMTGGPRGPGEIKNAGQVVAGTDPVAIDTYAAQILGKDPNDIKQLTAAVKLGVGQMDLTKLKVLKV